MRKFTAMLLCIIMIAVSIPLGTFTAAAEDVESVSEDDPVYYSDIFYAYSDYCNITAGEVAFNGSRLQYIYNLSAPTVILENESDAGVVFKSAISPSRLFDHKNNNFTLYYGSVFADFDNDGLTDNTDLAPTVANPAWDTDFDGAVDVNDLKELRVQLLDTSVLKTAQIAQSDINCDSEIDVRDLVHLKKQLVKWA